MKFNIDDMVSVSDVAPRSTGGGKKMTGDEIRVGITKRNDNRKSTKNAMSRIVIGDNIIKKLRWQKGDTLNVLFDNEHLLIRRENGGRYSLQLSAKKNCHSWRVGITLFPSMPCATVEKSIVSQSVEWEYAIGGVIFSVPQPTNRVTA